jgi:hypothetical protein
LKVLMILVENTRAKSPVLIYVLPHRYNASNGYHSILQHAGHGQRG